MGDTGNPDPTSIGASETDVKDTDLNDTKVSDSEIDVLNDEPEEVEEYHGDRIEDDDDDEVVVEEVETPEEGDEDLEVEVEEDLDEDLDEDLEDLDEEEPTRPSWKLIKEKYPELAKNKDFREIFYSNAAYREVFPTVGAAKEAAINAEAFETVATNIADGNIEKVLRSLNDEHLDNFSGSVLPALYAINPKLFGKAARPVLIEMLHDVHDFAIKTKDDNLRKSIRNVSRYLTKSEELPPRQPAPSEHPDVVKERDSLRAERQRAFDVARKDFFEASDTVLVKKLTTMIQDGLDPKKEMSDFDKESIVEKTLKDLQQAGFKDEALVQKIHTIEAQAARAGFSKEYRARMLSVYLARARKLIPRIRNKYIARALGKQPTKGPKPKVVTKQKVTTEGGKRVVTTGKIDMSKTSPEDFLSDRNIHYKTS